MPRFLPLFVIASFVASSATAQSATCKTSNPNCQGYATFGPAAVDRCISIRGQSRTDFCQHAGDSQRVLINSGDQYCAVQGSGPVPDQCTTHPITVTEPQ